MTVYLYKSALCPRCAYTHKLLTKLQTKYPNMHIHTYDIMTDFSHFKNNSIRMIPSISINNTTKSWLLPSHKEIETFIQKHYNKTA